MDTFPLMTDSIQIFIALIGEEGSNILSQELRCRYFFKDDIVEIVGVRNVMGVSIFTCSLDCYLKLFSSQGQYN